MVNVALGFPSARVALSVGEDRAILGSSPHEILHISEITVRAGRISRTTTGE